MTHKTNAARIADRLNAARDRWCDYRQVAQAEADRLGVGLYWAGTAAPAPELPSAEVWQERNGKWTRRLGTVALCHDGLWRAVAA